MMEAILFACGDPIDIDKLAQALNTEEENVLELSRTLQAKYNKEESGIHLLQLDHTLQFAVNPVFLAPVRTALDLRSSAPLSQAAMEVLAVIAYNQPVTKAFVEQVRGVDCSGVIGSLVQKALIEDSTFPVSRYYMARRKISCAAWASARFWSCRLCRRRKKPKTHLKTTGQTKHDRFMDSARAHRAALSSAVHPCAVRSEL